MKLVRATVALLALAVLLYAGTVWLPWQQQAIVAAVLVVVALCIDKASQSYLVTLTLMAASMYATYRYAWWRVRTVLEFLRGSAAHRNWADACIVTVLLLAEIYAFAVLYLGYAHTAWPLRRMPAPLPDDTDEWPAVDLLIPTFNEPLSVVRYTALAATLIDWPVDKLNVYLLDDGNRDEFRLFAEEAGIGYVTREDNLHAKAGNINAALAGMRAPLVAIFDSDHVPTRSFLQITVGWFLRDANLGMLQTPHHLYSPDPFERNLGQTLNPDGKRRVPSEGELFYGVVQDGNDFWNAAFFCGSCAVLRRSALDAVGGMAVETVTEDAHTSLRMQKDGWNTAYINIPQAAGLATERLSDYVRQRARWARGMVQILRTENPLFARGLTAMQRLCYFNAMAHFLYGLPRLVFLLAPLPYLLFGRTSMPGYWAAILAYAFPHLMLSVMTASRMQGQHRHSFWNEIYETVMAPFLVLPTLMALLRPKRGTFDVTAKGSVVYRRYFHSRIALPYLLLLGVNLLAVLCAIPRIVPFPVRLHGVWLGWLAGLYHPSQRGPVAMNLAWVVFNAVILGVACGVAWESRQRRRAVRVTMQVPAAVVLPDGGRLTCVTADVSSGGVMLRMDRRSGLHAGDPVRIQFPVLDAEASLPATIVHADGVDLRAQFAALSIAEEETLTQVLYSRADTWLRWSETCEGDRPLRSLWRIVRLSARGMKQTLGGIVRGGGDDSRRLDGAVVLALVLIVAAAACLALAPGVRAGHGETPARAVAVTSAVSATPAAASALPDEAADSREAGDFRSVLTLAELAGSSDPLVLRGMDAIREVSFAIPGQETVRSATLRLRYRVSPGLLPASRPLNVRLNGTLIDTVPVAESADGNGSLQAAFDLPAQSLVRSNVLTVEFRGRSSQGCDDAAIGAVWAALDGSSALELTGTRLVMDDDLKLLPAPFFEAGASVRPAIPVVFLHAPSPAAMQAAGIVASYFGSLAGDRLVRFPVSLGEIPQGNAIVVSERAADLPESLRLDDVTGATLAVRTNPADPYAKVLIVTGTNGAETVQAAQALALGHGAWQGAQAAVTGPTPPQSAPDDAPRWLRTDAVTHFSDLVAASELEGPGTIRVPLRLPPDLYFGERASVPLHLAYRYDAAATSAASALRVSVNGADVSPTPAPHVDRASGRLAAELLVPRVDLRPFRQVLGFDLPSQGARASGCADTAAAADSDGDRRGSSSIGGDSYLDLRGLSHRAEMPDLALFAQAGFPFTRLKDLSETSVVLPDAPAAGEMELFLSLMGHFGAATGYPALDVAVTGPAGMRAGSGRDTLVLGTVEDQPALRALRGVLPVQLSRGGWTVTRRDGWAGTWDTLRSRWRHWREVGPALETRGGLPDAVIEGAEWPRGSQRSVVVIALREAAVAPAFLSALLRDVPVNGSIAGSVSVLRGARFESYRVGESSYAVGSLPWLLRLQLLWTMWPSVLVLLVLAACVMLAAVTRVSLRRHALQRLQPVEE